MMELSEYRAAEKAETGFWVDIYPPGSQRRKKTGARIKVVGSDSKTYRKAAKNQAEALREVKNSPEARKKADCKMLAECTLDWEGLKLNGEPYTFDGPEKAFQLYMDEPWIAEQIDRAIPDRAQLFTKSGTS